MREAKAMRKVLAAMSSMMAASWCAYASPPLASIDFATGEARNLEVVGDKPAVVDFAGGRWLKLAAAPIRVLRRAACV